MAYKDKQLIGKVALNKAFPCFLPFNTQTIYPSDPFCQKNFVMSTKFKLEKYRNN